MTGDTDYIMHCFVCGSIDGLKMFPQRNYRGNMVGWIFVCKCHEDHEIPEVVQCANDADNP